MSVFKPALLPDLSNAKGRRYHIEHSPDDQVCPYPQGQTAREQLIKAGAIVNSADYEGGHGWHGDVYTRIHKGLTWLTAG
jgi:predicted esterase